MARLTKALMLAVVFLTQSHVTVFANGFEWREARIPMDVAPTVAHIERAAHLGLNVVSLLSGYEMGQMRLAELSAKAHALGIQIAAGGHAYSRFAPGGCRLPTDCWETFISAYRPWIEANAPHLDYVHFWPSDGVRWKYTSEEVWRIFLKIQAEFPEVKFVGIAYSTYLMPPPFPLPANTLVEVAPHRRYGAISLRHQKNGAIIDAWGSAGVRAILHDYGNRVAWQAFNVGLFFPVTMRLDARLAHGLGFAGYGDYLSMPGEPGAANFDYFAALASNVDARLPAYDRQLALAWVIARPCGMTYCGDLRAAASAMRALGTKGLRARMAIGFFDK